MKTIKYLLFITSVFLAFSCGDDFLSQKNLYMKTDESYYKTPADIEEALAGAYAALPLSDGNNNPFIVSELMSDDCFGGGGSNDDGFHSTDAFTRLTPDYYMNLFKTNWEGILRVNMILKRFNQAEYTDPDDKAQALGEAHFLRAFFYFRLSQFFGPVPLKLEPEPSNLPRATPEKMYGQIALDLKIAIDSMPSTRYENIDETRDGHATKWAAEALMARVFLFYTGYYNKTEITLPDGSTVTKNQVVTWLEDCINNSGHGLLTDFRNNWAYSFVNVRYPYAANNGLEWENTPEGKGSKETVFAVKYSTFGGWSPPDTKTNYSNQHVLYVGLRQQEYIPFGQGWGGGPVNPQLWESFDPNDIRREGSILNVNSSNPDEGTIPEKFVWGSDNQMHETGYWQKKYMPVYDSIKDNPATATVEANRIVSIFYNEFFNPDNMQQWNMQDDILIRFSDVLLMAAELGSSNAADYFNQVHTRAGLDAIGNPSLDDIKLERRHELAFEGLRYFDLLRWHGAEAAFATATNIPVKNVGVDEIYTVTFPAETGGFLPIPETEITLSNGVLEQTPGWE